MATQGFKTTLTNNGNTIIYFNYRRLSDGLYFDEVSLLPQQTKRIWHSAGSLIIDTPNPNISEIAIVFPPTGTTTTTTIPVITPTPSGTTVPTPTPSSTPSGTTSPTPTPTETPTGTTVPTPTPSPTPSPTSSGCTSPSPLTGYTYSLTYSYSASSSGETVMFAGGSPTDNPNTIANITPPPYNSIEFNRYDFYGNDTLSYFNGAVGNNITLTITESSSGDFATYSADTTSLQYWSNGGQEGFGLYNFGSGNITLISSASTAPFAYGQPVIISWDCGAS